MCNLETCGQSNYVRINDHYVATVYDVQQLKDYMNASYNTVDPIHFGEMVKTSCEDVVSYVKTRAKVYTELPEFEYGNDPKFAALPVWSGNKYPPKLGITVTLPCGFKSGKVVSYFVESGYLGVVCIPSEKPKFWINNRKECKIQYFKDKVLFFGIEVNY